ncbi:MAG: rRNA maturation RNase YbeY [Burkholderiaceae bacterium]|nr:rRNA maturation RNase YbeY [Burkholderiaceae bacterium]
MPAKNKLGLSIQHADRRLAEALPRAAIRRWAQAALFAPAELTIRLVGEDEGRELNRSYRGKDYATNVLTFAYADGDVVADDDPVQADIVLCIDVLLAEAAERKIPVTQHAAHLIVHGVLHAQGYDHEGDDEAAEMEGLETEILEGLGFPDPYAG